MDSHSTSQSEYPEIGVDLANEEASRAPSDSSESCGIDEDENDNEVQEPIEAVDIAEIPYLFDTVKASALADEHDYLATEKLERVIAQEPGMSAQALLPKLIEALDQLSTSTSVTFQNAVISLACSILPTSEYSRKNMMTKLHSIVSHLLNSDVCDRQSILGMLETLAEVDIASLTSIDAAIRAELYDPQHSLSPEQTVSAIEAFENGIIYGREKSTGCFIRAGALGFVLSRIVSPDPAVNAAAASCLTHALDVVDIADDENAVSSSPIHSPSPIPKTRSVIIQAFVKSVQHTDYNIALAAASFLTSYEGEEAQLAFAADPAAVIALILLLGKKNNAPGHIGSKSEWAVIKVAGVEGGTALLEAFRTVWNSSNLSAGGKLQVASGLADTFVDIRKIALASGMDRFLLDLASTQGPDQLKALSVVDQMMEAEQEVGYYLLQFPDTVKRLAVLLSSPSSEMRCLSASILGRLCDSYSPDDESVAQHPITKAAILSEDVFPQILAALYHQDPKTAGTIANLLGELIIDEAGTESWGYDDDGGTPPPLCPTKEKFLDLELIHTFVGLLSQRESAKGALYVLKQLCWGFTKAFDAVCASFETYIATADVLFFSALGGDYSGAYANRQRRRVVVAAVKAGALPRAFHLLETGASTIEERQAAVDGLAYLLSVDTPGVELARQRNDLPMVLATLIGDEDEASLRPVVHILGVLEKVGDQGWILSWGELGSPDVAQHLSNLLNKFPYNWDPERNEYPGYIEGDEYDKAVEAWTAKTKQSQEQCERVTKLVVEAIRLSLPILDPYSGPLLPPLLLRSTEVFDNRTILQTLNAISSSKDVDTRPLIEFIKLQMTAESLSADRLEEWAKCGYSIAVALQKAGVPEYLMKAIASTEEGSECQRLAALSALGAVIGSSPWNPFSETTQNLFFNDTAAFRNSVECLRCFDISDTAKAVSALHYLSEGFPAGLKALVEADVESDVLKLFSHEDVPIDDVAPFIGQLASVDPQKLTEYLRSSITALSLHKGRKRIVKDSSSVWARLESLSSTTSGARKAIVDAGAIDDAQRLLGGDNAEQWVLPISTLKALLDSHEGYTEKISTVLLRISELLLEESAPLTLLLKLLQAFGLQDISVLVSSFIVFPLVGGLATDLAAVYDDPAELARFINDIASTDEGAQAVVDALRELLALETAEEFETAWNYSRAIKWLTVAGEGATKTVVGAGGVEYLVRLLESDDIQIVARSAFACAGLALSRGTSALPMLRELGATTLVEAGQVKAHQAAVDNLSGLIGEDEDNVKRAESQMYAALAKKLAAVVSVLRGETREFEDD